MKKKVFSILASLLLVLGMMPITGAVAFGADHVHNYGTPFKAADIAGHESEYIKVGNDEYYKPNQVITAATCTKTGEAQLVCANCGEPYTATVDCKDCEAKGVVKCTAEGCDGGKIKCSAGCEKGKLICTTCNGEKSVNCSKCNGASTVTCTKCNGAKTVTCSDCGGDGTKGLIGKTGNITCRDCSGTGKVNCSTCRAKGTVDCNKCTGGKVRCTACNGKGSSTCKTCKGVGTVDCKECKYGYVTCETCKGKKQLENVKLTAVIPMLEHEYEWTTVLEATYLEDGYGYEICKYCGDNKDAEIIPKLVLDKVTGLKVSVKTAKQAKVSFKAVEGATGYKVGYKIKDGSYKYKTITKTSVTIKKLKGGKKYTFKVRALYDDGYTDKPATGAWSSTKTVKIKK